MSDDRIVIVSGADEAYALPLAVTLFSVAERMRPTEAADIYVLDGGFTERSRERFRRVLAATGRDVTIKFLQPQLKLLEGLPSGGIGPMSYLRVLIPDTLPPEINHAIYLDSDLLVQDSIGGLWRERSSEHAIAAVPDYGGPSVASPACLPNWSDLGLPADAPYIRLVAQ